MYTCLCAHVHVVYAHLFLPVYLIYDGACVRVCTLVITRVFHLMFYGYEVEQMLDFFLEAFLYFARTKLTDNVNPPQKPWLVCTTLFSSTLLTTDVENNTRLFIRGLEDIFPPRLYVSTINSRVV